MATRGATSTSSSASRTARPLLRPAAERLTLAVVVGALLVGFVIVVVREVLATFGVLAPAVDDSYELFAVSLTGLAGGVFAVGIGSSAGHPSSGRTQRLRSAVALAYVVTYALAGALALVVCLVRLGASTALLRSLAAAFLGTSVAAATAFIGVTVTSDRDDDHDHDDDHD
jgi:hypothetical protein